MGGGTGTGGHTPPQDWDREIIANWVGEMGTGICVTHHYQVAAWKYCLWSMGLYNGDFDGTIGRDCVAATKNFQQLVGLPADGIVGGRTCVAMGRAMKELDENLPMVAPEPTDDEVVALLMSAGRIMDETS